jgi:hypothetical protein
MSTMSAAGTQLKKLPVQGNDASFENPITKMIERAPVLTESPDIQLLGRKLMIASPASFATVLRLEKRRSERYAKPFLLVRIDFSHLYLNGHRKQLVKEIGAGLLAASRETDTIGWFHEQTSLGVMFTEIDGDVTTVQSILQRLRSSLSKSVGGSYFEQLRISSETFPEESLQVTAASSISKDQRNGSHAHKRRAETSTQTRTRPARSLSPQAQDSSKQQRRAIAVGSQIPELDQR